MNQNYQSQISDQICKIQTDKKLIALYDRLRYATFANYAQLHAKGEYSENERKVHSLIGVTIQDYSNGTGDKNIITQFNLTPEQIQFFLTRITAGFQEFEWTQSKIFGNPDEQGYSTVQQFSISRHVQASDGKILKNPWRIYIANGKGIKMQNQKGGSYMKKDSFILQKNAFIQLLDIDLYMLLKRADSYITNWEAGIAPSLIQNGKQMYADQLAQRQAQNQAQYQNTYQNGQVSYPAQGNPYAA